jgi:hypothetical protein
MVRWSDDVDAVLRADHVIMLAYATPARGAVLLPVTNFGVLDRERGVVRSVNTSVGMGTKLERMRRNPRVALAYHTRDHSLTDRPEYVLVQGTATLSGPIDDYPSTILENWERFEEWEGQHPLWKRWRRVYGRRVEVELAVERIVVWPDRSCAGEPEVEGEPLPAEPPAAQSPPRKGTGPRLDHRRAARRLAKLPHRVLGWIGADGFPVMAPVEVRGADDDGILLAVPPGIVPPGGRRAGLSAHWFAEGMIGQDQRKHTGWLEADSDRIVYAPHTDSSYRFPESTALYRVVSGGGTRWYEWRGRRAG